MKSEIQIIHEEINKIEQIVVDLRQAKEYVWNSVNSEINIITEIFMHLIETVQIILNEGGEFPIDVVLQQIKNFHEAFNMKDEILMADTLQYEIVNTMYVYLELLEGE